MSFSIQDALVACLQGCFAIDSHSNAPDRPGNPDRLVDRCQPKTLEARAMAGREEEDAGKCGRAREEEERGQADGPFFSEH